MNGVYNPLLVTLSILVAIFASYTALDLANSVTLARGRARMAWLAAGAIAMGVGIWSMHFVGMLAFEMPGMTIAYEVARMTLSVIVAVVASGLSLFVLSRQVVPVAALAAASLAMGAAIAGMHYIGIWSMRMAATIEWDTLLVIASILIAVAASFVALWLARRYRFDRTKRVRWIRAGGGIVMGLAIAGMHYTAMAAARFIPAPSLEVEGQKLIATDALGIAVTCATLLILAVAVAGSAVTRELTRRNQMASESRHLADKLEALNEQLIASEARLRGMIDSTLDAMVATDEHSIIVEWNRQSEIIFGWSAEEVIGLHLSDTIIPERYREPHRQGVARYLATGEAKILGRRIEITALRRDGTEFPIELSISPVRSGKRVLFTSFIRDISEQKHAEEQRRESERREQQMRVMEQERARLSALFEETPAFIAITRGPDHVYELRNARHAAMLNNRDVLGKPVREAFPELAEQGYVYLMDEVYRTGKPYVGVGTRLILRPDGAAAPQEFYVNFAYQPITDADGFVSGIFVHAVDVTDIVRARQEAESANQAKNEFLSRMSHELRTPLNAILGFGQLLELEAIMPGNRESANQIVRAGKHLLGLIDEVLDISRIEAGQVSLSVEPVHVARVLRESVELVRLMADKENITIHDGEALAIDHVVLADQQRLKQVMLNLLSNAIKYNRRGGTVTLSCAVTDGNRLRVTVADTGFGIPAQLMSRLYTPFDRLGAELSDVEGAGLGLALSRGLMDAMGGALHVESVEGEGTRFSVELETASVAAMPGVDVIPTKGAERDTSQPAAHTVLVIEDNSANVRLMERIFARRPDVHLITAMQGSLGLDLAREHHPDLILLDLNLPDFSGIEVLRAIRHDPALRHTRVVMISGDANPTQVQRLLDSGADAYITKPFDVGHLLDIIDGALARNAS